MRLLKSLHRLGYIVFRKIEKIIFGDVEKNCFISPQKFCSAKEHGGWDDFLRKIYTPGLEK